MPGRPPQVAWRCSRNELSGKAGAVHTRVSEWGDRFRVLDEVLGIQGVRGGYPLGETHQSWTHGD